MTDAITPDDFSFDEDTHLYRDSGGQVRMSTTQMMGRAKLVDYSGIPARVLNNARDRGIALHLATAQHDKREHYDIPDEWFGYFEGYMRFLSETRVRWVSVETSLLATVFGITFGMTFDRWGYWHDGAPVLGDLKFTAAAHPSWGIQTAIYEMGKMKRTRVGYVRRVAIQIKPNATYKLHWFDNPSDADVARSVMHRAHGIGDLVHHDRVLDTWRKNNNVRIGA